MSKGNRLELYSEKPITITEGHKTCVSLFSGLLGLELGLHKAGFAIKLAIDIDTIARETVVTNFPQLDYIVKDVSRVTASFILDRLDFKTGDIDLLAGGLPCQPFSKSGLRKGLSSDKGMLFEQYVRLLVKLKPKAFLLENVRGIVSSRQGQDFKEILDKFRRTGYTLYCKVLDAANYGVPQFRQRLFIAGFREQIKFSFPEKTHGGINVSGLQPFVTAQDAIGDLRYVKDFPPYRGKYTHLLTEIPEGLNYSYYSKKRGYPNPIFKWRSKFWYFLLKMERNRPSLTIQAYPGNNTGPFHWKNRKLGVSELKRLQTFPDWFELKGSYLAKRRHIGNAVPPLLAYKLGTQIARTLDEKNPLSKKEYSRISRNNNRLLQIDSGHRSGKGRLYVIDGRSVFLKSRSVRVFVEKILVWFNENRRKFPWRNTRDPYRILVTEHLLRKTTAKQVSDIYETFFTMFPSYVELAVSPKNKIKEIIRPLGLQNQRTQLLSELSAQLVELGGIPKQESELLTLPGVGQYCTDAVRCLAYGKDVPMVDRNVVRLIGRVFPILSEKGKTSSEKATKTVRSFIEGFLPKGNSKSFNLALLDFAAAICKAINPLCSLCPLEDSCNLHLDKV